ncbi:hypothetical protein JHK87_009956 [Glycine soja]|nr:hypothetical protein JHK87_009956 [Glycine soja]
MHRLVVFATTFELLLLPVSFAFLVRIEARGFIFGSPIALAIGAKFLPLRKSKKLPGKVISQEHILEYGRDCLEMHVGLELLNLDLMLGVADLHTLEAVATTESAISTFLQSAEFAAAES